MKLSVVIPVYHVENTLERCVQSVLQQNYDNMQIILVNDGSDDKCPELCDELAIRDSRITVIHQKNKGLGAARNSGIRHASGEYVTFVDSDDFLEPDTIPLLMEELINHPEYDIIEYPVIVKDGGREENLLTFLDRCYHSFHEYWLKAKGYSHSYACNKIYRRCLFNNTLFIERHAFEDVWTLPLLLAQSNHIAISPKGCYHYCENASGITARATLQDMQSLLQAHVNVLPQVWDTSNESIAYYMDVLNIQLTVAQMGGGTLLPPYPYRLKNIDFKNNKYLIKLFLLKILGIKSLCRIYKHLKHL